MNDPKNYQLAPSILDACAELKRIYTRCEDTNLDFVLQTELGAREYNAAPDESNIKRLAGDLLRAAVIIGNLKLLTTVVERRAIEAQGLLPWVFEE